MKRIELSSHLSLAYELGAKYFSKEEQNQLYGIATDEEVRGQNLKVKTQWECLSGLQPTDLYKTCLMRHKEQLEPWDHSFLKQEDVAFNTQALTLENLTVSLAEEFQSYEAPKCLAIEIEQGLWGVKSVVEGRLLDSSTQVCLMRQLRFQSLVRTPQRFEPIDMKLVLTWSGSLDRKIGLLRPWSELLAPMGQVFKDLRSEETKYFEAESTPIFLKKIALRFFTGDAARLLSDVCFIDTKDNFEISFNRLQDLS